MPFPNYHSARIKQPGQYEKFAYKNIAPGVDVVLGIKEGKSEAQAYRFDKTNTTSHLRRRVPWLTEGRQR
jgi:hypothetical protein